MTEPDERDVVTIVGKYLATTFPQLHAALQAFDELSSTDVASSTKPRYELIYDMRHSDEDARRMIDSCENENEREEIRRFIESQPRLRVIADLDHVVTTNWLGIQLS